MVPLKNYLSPDRIKIGLESDTRFGAIKELANLIFKSAEVSDKVDFLNSILLREEIKSTAIYPLIALPHGVTNTIQGLVMALGISTGGVDFQSNDGKGSRLVFLIATPPEQHHDYLQLLARIAQLFREGSVVERILASETPQQVLGILEKAEQGNDKLMARGA